MDFFAKKKPRSAFGLPGAFGAVRVVCVGVDRVHVIRIMVVIMVVVVTMIMPVIVAVVMVMMMRVLVLHLEPTKTRAERIAERAIGHVGARGRGALPFNMVVVAFLNCANFPLKPQNRAAIFAHHASGRRDRAESRVIGTFLARNRRALGGRDFLHRLALDGEDLRAVLACSTIGRRDGVGLLDDALSKSLKHLRVIPKIARFDKLHLSVLRRHLIGEAIDPVDQDAREEEIGEHDDALVAQLGRMLQAGLH